jgi:hypothetical protein
MGTLDTLEKRVERQRVVTIDDFEDAITYGRQYERAAVDAIHALRAVYSSEDTMTEYLRRNGVNLARFEGFPNREARLAAMVIEVVEIGLRKSTSHLSPLDPISFATTPE